METILKIKDIQSINRIEDALRENQPLSLEQKDILIKFLSELPSAQDLLSQKISIDEPIEIQLMEIGQIEKSLLSWKQLFIKLPGVSSCVDGFHVAEECEKSNNIAVSVRFAPTLAHWKEQKFIDLQLLINGSATIEVYTLENAEDFPELYKFHGAWNEAFYLLAKTMKSGWPNEKFPAELQKLLSK